MGAGFHFRHLTDWRLNRYYSLLPMSDSGLHAYVPLLIHLLAAVALAGALTAVSVLVGWRRPSRAKQQAYECGMEPTGDARQRAWDPKAIVEVMEFRGETTLVIPRELLRAAAERCREYAELRFKLPTDATCVDRFPHEPRFELNYHLVSIPRRDKVRLKVRISGADPVVDSLVPVWPGANWLEREIFDLFGIRFNGHPDLRRILLT